MAIPAVGALFGSDVSGEHVLVAPGLSFDGVACPAPAALSHGTTPPYDPPSSYQPAVQLNLERYRYYEQSPFPFYQDYQPAGDYLNYSVTNVYKPAPGIRFDAQGIPLILYGSTYFYNPVTVAEYALHLHGRWATGVEGPERFVVAADKLVSMQGADGGFPYPFSYAYYRTREVFPVGWTSAMAQGQALSVLSRAYRLTSDERYLAAGNAALVHLLGRGQTLASLHPSLADYRWYAEYPTAIASYTLNGFMFTLIGLYDWWHLDTDATSGPAQDAHTAFSGGMRSLVYVLPYYDGGGFSIYDLGHLTMGGAPNFQWDYHVIHLSLLHVLGGITDDYAIQCTEALWQSYVHPAGVALTASGGITYPLPSQLNIGDDRE